MSNIIVQGQEIGVIKMGKEDYISLTHMASSFENAEGLIERWIRNKDTLEFLGIWESINNENFKPLEFEGLLKDAGTNRFSLSAKKWVETAGAVGIISKQGKGGGTYAHKDIAFEFGSWLSPTFKLYLIKEFQRLKEVESNVNNLEWDTRRMLSKANYHLHTEAIKECIIPEMHLDKDKEWIVYANEADIINVALFGCTAKQWKEANPTLALQGYNIREVASINQLVVLSNMENNNSVFIRNGFDRKNRFAELKRMAQEQLAQFNRIYPEKSFRKAVEGSYTPSPQKQIPPTVHSVQNMSFGDAIKKIGNAGKPKE